MSGMISQNCMHTGVDKFSKVDAEPERSSSE